MNTHFWVLQNIDFICLWRQYQTLPLLSRVCLDNSTTWILFCRVKICKCYSFMNNFFKQFWHENYAVNAAFLTNLFIRTNKELKFCHIWTLCRNFIKILQALGSSATQDTRVLEALWHLRHSGTQDTWDTLFSRLQCTTLIGILTMFAKFLNCHHWMLTLKETSTLPHFK